MTGPLHRTLAQGQVALLGIVVAGGVAVVIGEGRWDIYDSITGAVLLVLLIALDRRRPAESHGERIAFAAAASLTLVLMIGRFCPWMYAPPPSGQGWQAPTANEVAVVVTWLALGALCFLIRWLLPPRKEAGQGRSSPTRSLYDLAEPTARRVKTALQMVIGIAAVIIIGGQFIDRQFLTEPAPTPEQATMQLLDGVAVALAAAAVIELAYTLFTKGPDEALDPLMLGIAATLIIRFGKYPQEGVHASELLLLGTLLAVLFVVRLTLAERHDEDEPKIWWVQRLKRRTTGDPAPPPPDQAHEEKSA